MNRSQFAAAVARAKLFWRELDVARSDFIDNRAVELWKVSYAADFSLLTKEPRRAGKDVLDIADVFNDLRRHVDRMNAAFIREESARNDGLFGRLDKSQREACVADEVATLVVAGAGSGKTSTIEKKVEYLIKVRGVSPDDILLLAFTNKAADEMTERLAVSMPNAFMVASTFHKFGLGILKAHRAGCYDIGEPQLCTDTVLHAISPETMTEEECRGLVRFFAFCLNAEPSDPNGFKTFGDYINKTRHADLKTLRGFVEDCPTAKTTFLGERVKSLEELEIANWLYLNGIAYEYERKYDRPILNEGQVKFRHYKPDFYLTDYGIWLEHFGVDVDGEPPRFFSKAERAAYKAGMAWKRKLHAANNTILVESYSWWHSEGKLTDNLWEALKVHGVRRHGLDPKPIWKKICESSRANFLREFAKLVSAFIALAKSNRITSDSLEKIFECDRLEGNVRRRVQCFLDQVRPLFRKYEEVLAKGEIYDFNDMINEATDFIEGNPECLHKFRYVIVDEFQDISVGRAKLVQAVLAATGAKLFCVGDDWQSIYRFAGSDISIFTHFQEHFGFARIIRLTNTYRNSQELLSVAGAFVMKNHQQLRKSLTSVKHCERPVVCVPYDSSHGIADAIHVALAEIAHEVQGVETSVLLLGRHNYESRWPLAADDIRADENYENFTWDPHKELKLRFMTIHKAKGLEADYVILLNFNDDLLGFPNAIADDPVLSLLLSAKEDIAFAEERRVFYVALTRTKNRIYILTPKTGASVFLDDLPKEVVPAISGEVSAAAFCPKCKKGRLIIRHRAVDDSETFYGCTNFPHCDYTLPIQCVPITFDTPRCTCGGFLVPKKNPRNGEEFLGCTEFSRLQPYRHVCRRIEHSQWLPKD